MDEGIDKPIRIPFPLRLAASECKGIRDFEAEHVDHHKQSYPVKPKTVIDELFDTDEIVNDSLFVKSVKRRLEPKFKAEKDKTEGSPKFLKEIFEEMIDRYIPCLLLAPSQPTAKVTVFYHANAEDIGQTLEFCEGLNEKLDVIFIS